MDHTLSQGFAALDVPDVLLRIFHPRPEFLAATPAGAADLAIPVAEGVTVGARFHPSGKTDPVLLFFHGNGEIVADYDELAPFYTRLGVNFLPVDYRGYGRSGGRPTVSAMMQDAHAIFRFAQDWLRSHGYTGPLAVMGRSLGSAPALELAAQYPAGIAGLIVESGFAYAGPLLRLLGVDVDALGFKEDMGFRNVDKIRKFTNPTLIIHAELDHIIPFADGQVLYEASPAPDKTLLKIPGATHNDLLSMGFADYLAAIRDLMGSFERPGS
jgi:pimeloyl-ACP methyl ester carboxylesterase